MGKAELLWQRQNCQARPLSARAASKSHADSLVFTACNCSIVMHAILQMTGITAACINNRCE
jgi:hypothetical protein